MEKLELASTTRTKKIDHYYLIKKLGSGTFAEVSLGLHEFLEKKVAVKKISKRRIKAQRNVNRHKMEIKIMKSGCFGCFGRGRAAAGRPGGGGFIKIPLRG